MFFSSDFILWSINELKSVHPFHGITFLACKKANLNIAQEKEFAMDKITGQFLDQHHKLDPDSNWYYQPFKSTKNWLRHDYAASGLQAINTQTFSLAFVHTPNTRIWAWSSTYVAVLESKLVKKKPIPAFALAVWIYRDKKWPKSTDAKNILDEFIREFNLSSDDLASLFDVDIPQELPSTEMMLNDKISWPELRQYLDSAPDAKPDQGGTLAYLKVTGLGPAKSLSLKPAKRLSLITGDNGLGKTFLLECAWWSLTGVWAGRPALPRPSSSKLKSEITFSIVGEQQVTDRHTLGFDWTTQSWPTPLDRPTIPGLMVYARVDGSFAIWDPAKHHKNHTKQKSVFSNSEIWDGLSGHIEGLIRDWVKWQSNPSKYPFELFTKVLDRLSAPDLGVLEVGEPVRIPHDPRDIPTLRHPYGTIPILYSSAGVKRIITIAYLIVWAWNEHLIAAELSRSSSQKRMVILIDEMEAHLHPKWQREVLPALMGVGEMLSESLEIQFIVATHSPLVMASSEPIFNSDSDSVFHLDMETSGNVTIEEVEYQKFGDISSWLTSPFFELKQARSREAETAIQGAVILQKRTDITHAEVKEASAKLIRYLGDNDKFWPRWISFAEKYGVDL
jgi:hypothetical protein